MQHHKASLSDLPLETLKAVACLLPARAIVRLSTTCRALRPIVAVPAVWERIDFSDIEPGLTDAGYTGFLAQITKWMAPYSPKNDITGMVTGHLPTEIVEMKFDGTVVSYYTVIAAMRLPRAQRVSFQGCRIDDIPDDLEGMLLQEYAAKALVTAQANDDGVDFNSDTDERDSDEDQ
ncbi:hypothetical protein M427DRAFT_68969 [Gonapodya prolifera JEL478]|uniref:F-box domain-containing protein n=1 Tax=Gonapodya prolifera (strain JEL478) TaxID=1344416 RepID=A0A139AIY1_GONPJ|nr:hypothetical protein M427DRAFT_68969 [Gonapodya prolifera JEL478]|eukprot:KXS16679.1 hypothetical protein M427DRAFT_68969 [Gonapodya prolifera JEL478]